MRNLIVGMRTITEQQIENNAFSHKNNLAVDYSGEDSGIDRWRAIDGDYKVISVLPYNTTRFANTLFVIPVDSNGKHEVCMTAKYGPGLFTLIFAHDNKVRHKVGDIIKKGSDIYFEGTSGNATGNHIHFELSKGYITKKIKNTATGKGYINPDPIAPSENMFLLKGYHIVRRDIGDQYTWVDSIETDINDTETDINDTEISIEGITKVVTYSYGLNLRNSPLGDVVGILPPNTSNSIDTISILKGFQKDKFQWASITINKKKYYIQLDLAHITLE